MAKYFYVLLVALNIGFLKANPVQLKWGENKSMLIENGNSSYKRNYIYFENASYPNSETLIPYFQTVLDVDNDGYVATIANEVFELVPSSMLEGIIGLDSIGESVVVKSNVFFSRKRPKLTVEFVPLVKRGGVVYRLTSFDIKKEAKLTTKAYDYMQRSYQNNSVLRSGKWTMIKILKDGVYKLSYDQLLNMGVSNPMNVRVHGFGGGMLPESNKEFNGDDLPEVQIYLDKGIDGVFNSGDFCYFYAKGSDKWTYNPSTYFYQHLKHLYSDASYYFITSDLAPGTPPATAPTESTFDVIVNEYDDYKYVENNESNLIRSGRNFYEPITLGGSKVYAFNFPNLAPSSTAKIEAKVVGKSSDNSNFFTFSHNGATLLTINTGISSSYQYALEGLSRNSFTPASQNVNIEARFTNNINPSAKGWIDYVTINARCNLNLYSDQLIFRDRNSLSAGKIGRYEIVNGDVNTMVWDVTNPNDIKNVNTNLTSGTIAFNYALDSLREFVAFKKDETLLTPEVVGVVSNQNIHGAGQPDFVIVTHPKFKSQANELARYRRENNKMNVLVVENQEIYNEFSSGAPDVTAIRNMMRMFYERAKDENELPKYLLLFGDGSYDNRPGTNNSNYVLTFQAENSLHEINSFVSDDYFSLMDYDESGYIGMEDIGVGRIPVQTEYQATTVLNKIKNYNSINSFGDWRNKVTFIGDDEDSNEHLKHALFLSYYVEDNYPQYNVNRIMLDAYKQVSSSSGTRYPDVKSAIKNQIETGTLIMSYSGHGGEEGLAHERIVEIDDILSWTNINRLTFLFTASCEVTRYDDYARTSAGEHVLLNDKGGGIALMSTTRAVYGSQNFELSKHLFNYMFEKDANGNYLPLGEIVRLGKSNYATWENKRNFTLFGDPSLTLAYPKSGVTTTHINSKEINVVNDTLNALSKVTIKGQITNQYGSVMSDFKGVVYPSVYDKRVKVKTLKNDENSIETSFYLRNSIIYKGKSTVQNGKFEFSFIVPKDIMYNFDFGKISYYAYDNQNDYNGYFDKVVIGGSSPNIVATDVVGPEIKIYLNNENFVSGGITDASPKLISNFLDESGINTVGNGIGHDITLKIKPENTIVNLNQFYESELNSYTQGKVNYPISELKDGEYTLELKAWDVYNNSTVESIDFVVFSEKDLTIDKLLNYPNPFTTYTEFHFEHNQPNKELDILIQIFTITGKLIKTIRTTTLSDGFKPSPIPWDGLDDYGDRIGRGTYIYKIKVKGDEGKVVEKIEKLVILR